MKHFPILSMHKGMDVVVRVKGREIRGVVEATDTSDWSVLVQVADGEYDWFYTDQGATFHH